MNQTSLRYPYSTSECRATFFLCALLFIVSWWLFAFSGHVETPTSFSLPSIHSLEPYLKRSELHQALSGDFRLMHTLIKKWSKDVPSLNHLHSNQKYIDHLLEQTLHNFIQIPSTQFLPQTYLTADFLLALVKPQQVMALPNGFRTHTILHTTTSTNLIPLDFHEVSQEKLVLSPPTMAFIAPYSNPHVVSRLKAQNIPLFITKNIQSIADIHEQLLKIGHSLQRPDAAKLLSIFMEAAFTAIDHFLVVNQINNSSPNSKILYLSHYGHFSMPAFNTLIGELLKRLGISQAVFTSGKKSRENEWIHAVTTEKIAAYQPGGIIVSISGGSSKKEELLRKLKPSGQAFLFPSNKLCLVEEKVQQSTSQYAVLAYYDLANAILHFKDD